MSCLTSDDALVVEIQEMHSTDRFRSQRDVCKIVYRDICVCIQFTIIQGSMVVLSSLRYMLYFKLSDS